MAADGLAAGTASWTISLVALYVAVVSLAETVGGSTSQLAAAAIGVFVAVGLTLAVFTRGVTRVSRTLAAAMAGCALLLSILSGREGWNSVQQNRTKDKIEQVVLASYAAELAWYQHPSEDRLPELERYFVAPQQGGERLAVIRAAVARLRRCNYRMGPGARGSTFFDSVTISHSTARANTLQSLFQSGQQYRHGRWQPRPIQAIVYVPQSYLLQKVGGRWLVAAAPQEQNTGAC